MKGNNIKVKKLHTLRRNGYSFLKNGNGTIMKVYYRRKLLYFIRVKQNGHLIVKDKLRKVIFCCEGIEFFLNPFDNGLGILIAT